MKKSNVDEAHVQLHMGIFFQKWCSIFSFIFLSILERKFFGGFRKKIPEFQHLFSFLSTKPNILQKSFLSHFYFIVFHPLYFTFKQIHPKGSFGWKSGKVGGWKNRRIEKILFSLLFVWLGVEKWRDEKNGFK